VSCALEGLQPLIPAALIAIEDREAGWAAFAAVGGSRDNEPPRLKRGR
jgi:hypothetical protein